MDLENNVPSYFRVQFRFDCIQMKLGYSSRMKKERNTYAIFGVNRCVSTCVYPEGGKNHYPWPSIILLWSDQSWKGLRLELQHRQMGNAWGNSKLSGSLAKFLSLFDLANLLLQSFRWSSAELKNSIQQALLDGNTHRYDAWSCYKIKQSTWLFSRRLNNAHKPCPGLMGGKFEEWRAPEYYGLKIMSSWSEQERFHGGGDEWEKAQRWDAFGVWHSWWG